MTQRANFIKESWSPNPLGLSDLPEAPAHGEKWNTKDQKDHISEQKKRGMIKRKARDADRGDTCNLDQLNSIFSGLGPSRKVAANKGVKFRTKSGA